MPKQSIFLSDEMLGYALYLLHTADQGTIAHSLASEIESQLGLEKRASIDDLSSAGLESIGYWCRYMHESQLHEGVVLDTDVKTFPHVLTIFNPETCKVCTVDGCNAFLIREYQPLSFVREPVEDSGESVFRFRVFQRSQDIPAESYIMDTDKDCGRTFRLGETLAVDGYATLDPVFGPWAVADRPFDDLEDTTLETIAKVVRRAPREEKVKECSVLISV